MDCEHRAHTQWSFLASHFIYDTPLVYSIDLVFCFEIAGGTLIIGVEGKNNKTTSKSVAQIPQIKILCKLSQSWSVQDRQE